MKKPVVINDFISSQDSESFISYLDQYYILFPSLHNRLFTKRLGKDNHFESEGIDSSQVKPVKDLIIKYSKKFEAVAKESFNFQKDLYISQFWLAKRLDGIGQNIHDDTDGGKNTQLRYSGIIYLNTLDKGGELIFPKLNYTYLPNAGDLVMFPSDDRDYDHGVNMNLKTRYTLPIWLTDDKEYALLD